MVFRPLIRIRLWLEHSVERAEGMSTWTVWFLAAAVGVITSYGVIAFTLGIEWIAQLTYGEGMNALAQGARDLDPWRAFFVPVAGGVFVGFLLWLGKRTKSLPDVNCMGVADVIEARAQPPGHITVRGGIINTVATGAALGTGASAGREGPLVLMGAAISTFLSERFGISGREARTLLGCSAAAAVAAGFNAPIAGVLFALEVVLSNYALSVFGPVTLASITSVLIAQAHLGDLHRFNIPEYGAAGAYDVPLGAVLGLVCGAVAWLFLQTAAKAGRIVRNAMVDQHLPPAFLPPIAGIIMGVMAIFLPEVLGVGYEATTEAVNGNYTLTLLIALLFAKIFATVICLACKFGTGVFSGGIYLGAITGAAFGLMMESIAPGVASPTFYAMIGMGAVSGAIIGAPISTTLIVFEITGDYEMTAALMIAVGIATVITQVFFGSSWFHYQLNQRGYDLSDGPQGVILKTIRVRDVMRPVSADAAPLEEAVDRLYAGQNLGEALAVMADKDLSAMPVVASGQDAVIIGTLTQVRALKHYNTALIDSHVEHHR